MKSVVQEVEALVARVGTHPVWGHAHCLRVAMVGTEEDVQDIGVAVYHAESLGRRIPDVLVLEASEDIAHRRAEETDQFMDDPRDATAEPKLL